MQLLKFAINKALEIAVAVEQMTIKVSTILQPQQSFQPKNLAIPPISSEPTHAKRLQQIGQANKTYLSTSKSVRIISHLSSQSQFLESNLPSSFKSRRKFNKQKLKDRGGIANFINGMFLSPAYQNSKLFSVSLIQISRKSQFIKNSTFIGFS